jgi:Catalase
MRHESPTSALILGASRQSGALQVTEKSTRDFQDPKNTKKHLAACGESAMRQIPDGAQGLLTTIPDGIVADTRNTLRSAEQGPSLLEDFTSCGQITYSNHERIPELIVNARASFGQYVEAAKQQRVWDREVRLSEGDV